MTTLGYLLDEIEAVTGTRPRRSWKAAKKALSNLFLQGVKKPVSDSPLSDGWWLVATQESCREVDGHTRWYDLYLTTETDPAVFTFAVVDSYDGGNVGEAMLVRALGGDVPVLFHAWCDRRFRCQDI